MSLKIVEINTLDDWRVISKFLLEQASAAPLDEPDSAHYSVSETEAWERVRKGLVDGRINEMTQYNAVAIRHNRFVSFVMTFEPDHVHLSMTEVIPNQRMRRLDDPLAAEASECILGICEEREEGILPDVRHFYKRLS